MNTTEHLYDVVVLGSGIAGQSAATAAAEAGLSTVLLEKTSARGGSSAMSGGFFAFSGTEEQAAEGIDDSAELFRRDLIDTGGSVNDPALLDAYLNHQEETFRWLKDHGTTVRALELSSGQSAARSHNTEIRAVLDRLHQAFERHGGTTLTGHRGLRLTRNDDGPVTGVIVDTPDGETRFTARRGVILATGGFSRGNELLRTFAPEQLAAIPYGGIGNTGDGLKMAWKLGAGMADMAHITATYGSHPDTGDEFHELLTAFYLGAIIVNRAGQRFTDESQSYKTLGRAVLQQPEGLGFQIFDAAVRRRSHPGIPLNDIGMLEDLGHVYRADSLAELATAAGIDADGLHATVERYNSALSAGEVDEQGRTSRCNGVGELEPLAEGPFYAYPAKALMTSTYCGVTTTPDAQVVDVDGDVIDGLYAVGELVGGFHGVAYMTGTSLGKGAIFGRLAAAHCAARQVSTGFDAVSR